MNLDVLVVLRLGLTLESKNVRLRYTFDQMCCLATSLLFWRARFALVFQ